MSFLVLHMFTCCWFEDDHSSKNKLRLLRLTKVLCDESLAWRLGAFVITSAPIDEVLYALLGHQRTRATMSELVDPHSSPLVKCQSKLLHLAKSFLADEASPWFLLGLVGGDFGSVEVRMACRNHVLQLAGGVTQYFELRMSKGLYRLAWLCLGSIPRLAQRVVVRDVFSSPLDCLPFACRLLRLMYPNEERFSRAAPTILRTWLASVIVGIDFSERCHAQMRRYVESSGPAASFRGACNRLVCRQFVADHVLRGGIDPAIAPLSMFLGEEQGEQDGAKDAPKTAKNSFIYFHAMRMKSVKALLAPNRAFSRDELVDVEAKISQEWHALSEADVAFWDVLRKHRPQRQAIVSDASSTGASSSALVPLPKSTPFRGLWGHGDNPKHLVPPLALANPRGQQGIPWSKSQESSFDRCVSRPVPKRASLPLTHGWGSLHGCHSHIKNACRQHSLKPEEARSLDFVCAAFNAWVGSLPKESRGDASQVLLCFGAGAGEEPSACVVALLVHATGNKQGQLFADCALVLASGLLQHVFEPQEFPFRVRIMSRTSRLSMPGNQAQDDQSLSISTSDEFGMLLLEHKPSWTFFRGEYELVINDTLLDMLVTRKGEEVKVPAAAVRAKKKGNLIIPNAFDSILDCDDPIAQGRQGAVAPSAAPSASSAAEHPQDDLSASDVEVEGGGQRPSSQRKSTRSWKPALLLKKKAAKTSRLLKAKATQILSTLWRQSWRSWRAGWSQRRRPWRKLWRVPSCRSSQDTLLVHCGHGIGWRTSGESPCGLPTSMPRGRTSLFDVTCIAHALSLVGDRRSLTSSACAGFLFLQSPCLKGPQRRRKWQPRPGMPSWLQRCCRRPCWQRLLDPRFLWLQCDHRGRPSELGLSLALLATSASRFATLERVSRH